MNDNQNYDDPMLTAYALGELDDEDFATERAAIEARLAEDEAARKVVEEIRASGAMLEREFQTEAADAAGGLTDAQRATVIASVGGAGQRGSVLAVFQRVAVAAGLVGIVGVATYAVIDARERDAARKVARVETKTDEGADLRGLAAIDDVTNGSLKNERNTPEATLRSDYKRLSDVVKPAGDTRLADTPAGYRLQAEEAKAREVAQKAAKGKARFFFGRKPRDSAGLDNGGNGAPVNLPKLNLGAPSQPTLGYIGPAGSVVPNVKFDGSVPHSDPTSKGPPKPVVVGAVVDHLKKTPSADPAKPPKTPAGLPVPLVDSRTGLPVKNVKSPTAEAFLNDGADGDIRGRTENVFDRALARELLGVDADDEKKRAAAEVRLRMQLERLARERHNTESYGYIVENPFTQPTSEPLSTFSIDVDTASYANARRFITQGALPPKGALRVEEFLNYFRYNYPQPVDGRPFSVNVETASCPWAPSHRIARIGIKGREIPKSARPASNFVFLLDVSGSMRAPNKLPYVKQAMRMLVEQFDEGDRVAIVTYAGQSGVALKSTPCNEKTRILNAMRQLNASGSTNGAAGIRLAYQLVAQNFIRGGNNRVILCTDGDFNVGVSSNAELIELIKDKAQTGGFLSILGFGSGNYKDDKLEGIAQHGNGNYHYIDSLKEAQKVLVDELAGTLITIAKDVKIQVEFNPSKVTAYRLLGYENRTMAARDFNDDTKDAGEIGAGHTVTALYEIVPAGVRWNQPGVDTLKYQKPKAPASVSASPDLMTVKLRYKLPEATASTRFDVAVQDQGLRFGHASHDTQFAVAVAGFCLVMRDSAFRGNATLAQVLELATVGLANDPKGRRAEFIELVRRAQQIKR